MTKQSLRLPVELVKKITAQAQLERRTFSDMLRLLIEDAIKMKDQNKEKAS